MYKLFQFFGVREIANNPQKFGAEQPEMKEALNVIIFMWTKEKKYEFTYLIKYFIFKIYHMCFVLIEAHPLFLNLVAN